MWRKSIEELWSRFGNSGLSTNLGVWKQNLCGLLAMLTEHSC